MKWFPCLQTDVNTETILHFFNNNQCHFEKKTFFSQVKVVNVEQERQVMEDVIRSLDRHENDNLPQVKLSTAEVLYRRY